MGNDVSNSLFILGAGFTKAAIPEAPLNCKLLDAINKANPEAVLAEYSEKYGIYDDIEVLLTHIDLELSKNPDEILKAKRKQIQEQIAHYFTRFRFKKENPPAWVKAFANEILRPNDAIVSLNYDCYLEGALDYFGVWTPNDGYPIPYRLPAQIASNPKNIKIYKIHGSENYGEAITWERDRTYIGFKI